MEFFLVICSKVVQHYQILKHKKILMYLNSTSFSSMFYGCSLLSDIKPLEKWNVSNCTSFSSMFYSCSLLSNIKSLEKWNVSNRRGNLICIDFLVAPLK